LNNVVSINHFNDFISATFENFYLVSFPQIYNAASKLQKEFLITIFLLKLLCSYFDYSLTHIPSTLSQCGEKRW